MKEVSILSNFSKKMIKENNYIKAKQAILKALTYSPESSDLYVSLGNIYYLCKQREHSFRAYLAATHLNINKLKTYQRGTLGTMLEVKFNNLPEDEKLHFVNKYSLLVYNDTTISKHIAHAYIDLVNSEYFDPIVLETSELYEESLVTNTSASKLVHKYNLCIEDFDQFELSHYIMLGRELILNSIQWNEIDCTEVRKLYF